MLCLERQLDLRREVEKLKMECNSLRGLQAKRQKPAEESLLKAFYTAEGNSPIDAKLVMLEKSKRIEALEAQVQSLSRDLDALEREKKNEITKLQDADDRNAELLAATQAALLAGFVADGRTDGELPEHSAPLNEQKEQLYKNVIKIGKDEIARLREDLKTHKGCSLALATKDDALRRLGRDHVEASAQRDELRDRSQILEESAKYQLQQISDLKQQLKAKESDLAAERANMKTELARLSELETKMNVEKGQGVLNRKLLDSTRAEIEALNEELRTKDKYLASKDPSDAMKSALHDIRRLEKIRKEHAGCEFEKNDIRCELLHFREENFMVKKQKLEAEMAADQAQSQRTVLAEKLGSAEECLSRAGQTINSLCTTLKANMKHNEEKIAALNEIFTGAGGLAPEQVDDFKQNLRKL